MVTWWAWPWVYAQMPVLNPQRLLAEAHLRASVQQHHGLDACAEEGFCVVEELVAPLEGQKAPPWLARQD